MPRGRKKKTVAVTAEEIRAAIAAAEADIESTSEKLKALKERLKGLKKDLVLAEAQEAAARAEEEKRMLLEAFEKSGKSLEEVMEMLNK